MAKLTLTDITNLTNQTTAIAQINANGALIEAAMENTLSRDGSTPNTMTASLDMNSKSVLNVATLDATDITLDGISILASLPTVTPRGAWVTATGYIVGDLVSSGGVTYICNTTHTSGVFATDDGSGYWSVFASLPATVKTPERFNGDGATTVFVLSTAPTSEDYISVYIDGVYQNHGVGQYSLSGATITFTAAPPIGTGNIEVVFTVGTTTVSVGDVVPSAGIQMTWESLTTDTDQGPGKVWANNSTLSSATVLYFDDVDNKANSVNALIDTLDDPTASNSALIYIQESGTGGAGVVFQVNGAVTSASTYSKVSVSHLATLGTLADADTIGVVFAHSGNNGAAGGGSGDLIASNNLSDVDTAATAFTNIKQAASTTATGVVELATDAETNTGTDTARAITPANLTAWTGDTGVVTLGTITTGTWTGTNVAVAAGGTGSSTAAGAATNLGLGTGDSPQHTGVNLGHASDTTLTRSAAGVLAVEGVAQAAATGVNATKQVIAIAASDETTALTTGTAKATFHMPYGFTLTGVKAGVTTAPTGAALTVDINEAGTTILSTKLTIDVSEKTSGTAATPAVISDASLAVDALMTVDIDVVGSTIAGAGLKVYLIGYIT
jgi:hypothetical protein